MEIVDERLEEWHSVAHVRGQDTKERKESHRYKHEAEGPIFDVVPEKGDILERESAEPWSSAKALSGRWRRIGFAPPPTRPSLLSSGTTPPKVVDKRSIRDVELFRS